ncbi:MAG: ABC-three component system protein [Candidatus Thiodiazotropha taylori]
MSNSDQFSASESTLGYLYQLRCALLWSLRRLKETSSFETSIETLDDISFESKGSPIELLQTKFHKNRGANLTDASPDIWKTIRIWLTELDEEEITESTDLYIVTTENAAPGTTAAYLKIDGRDEEAALQLLESTAQSSTNKANASAYEIFLAREHKERLEFVRKIYVLDSAPDIDDLNDLIKKELFHAVDRDSQDVFLNYLEGWWFGRTIKQLKNIGSEDRILSEEIEAQMADLRDSFRHDFLPISEDLKSYVLDEETAEAHAGLPFVQQVELATKNSTRIAAAIRDYYRAFEQRSRWQREELLFIGDLSNYEKSLTEEWELIFSGIEDDLNQDASESEKQEAARAVLKWAETGTINSRIKPGVADPFISRGSLHILSNDMKIGWHPEFKGRLAHLLGDNEQ